MLRFFFAIRCLEFIWYSLSQRQDCSSSLQAGTCSCSLAAIPLEGPVTVDVSKYKAYHTAHASVQHLLVNTFCKKRQTPIYELWPVNRYLYACRLHEYDIEYFLAVQMWEALSVMKKNFAEPASQFFPYKILPFWSGL